MLKVAILSGWHVHAEGYAYEFAALPNVSLTVMWDENPERGKAFAKKFNIPFEPDLDALLASSDVDAVCVNTPTNMHRDVIVKAANAKKHIFTEKVLALTMAECADIKAAIEKNGVKFCISFPHRTAPHNLYAKKIMDDNVLGEVTLMRVRNAHNGASAGWLPPHFYDPVECGGGAMMDLGAHPMYLISWLMGRPVEISSAFTAYTNHAVEDNAVSVMKFKNGAIAVSETGFVSGDSPFALELYGTEGALIIGQGGIRLKTKDGWLSPGHLPAALPGAIPQFVDGILHGGVIHFGLDDAIALTELMENAYISDREGRHVKFL
jgi:predicted dehydrogenase